jgi:preprotein translocase subunit SecE
MPTKLVSFLKEARAEFKRVSWPSREKTVRLTAAVFAIVVAAALFIAVLDYLFNLGIGWLVAR